MDNNADIRGIYRHYKGNEYEVIGEAIDTETEACVVVYKSTKSPHTLWVRPYDMFFESIIVDNKQISRFEKQT